MLHFNQTTAAPHGRTWTNRLVSILRNARSYVAFFVALFIIEAMFTVLFTAAANDIRMADKLVSETYDYELEYRGMTQPQYTVLLSRCGTQPAEGMEEFYSYRSIRYEKMEDGTYNAYITLYGENRSDEAFLFLDLYALPDIEISYSPLYDFHTRYLPDIWVFVVVCTLAVFALALFLLVALYRMRLDRDTFTYGVYMTCGATYRALYHRTCSELLTYAALVLLPALAMGLGITAALYAARGAALSFAPGALLLVLVFSVLTILCAVRIPIFALSRKAPIALLAAKDNSTHLSSPRRSKRIVGAVFPRDYELLSLWRYRRYLAGLLLSCLMLPVLFVGARSLSDILVARQSAPAPDFTVTFEPEVINEPVLNQNTAELSAAISAINGVAMCLPESITCSATGQSTHLLLPKKSAAKASQVSVRPDPAPEGVDADRYTHATNAFSYTALDEAAIRALEVQYNDIEGDLRAVLSDDRTIVISESIYNERMFDFSIGDTLLLATAAQYPEDSILPIADRKDLLLQQLEHGTFVYEEYTIGAIIHDNAGGDALIFGVNFDTFENLTGTTPVRFCMDVYLSDEIGFADWERISDEVYAAAHEYYNCIPTDHGLFFDRYITSFRNLGARLDVLAWSFCLMMPLVCFFSQHIFYTKRRDEWDILLSLGATERQILHGAAFSGLITAAIMLALILPLTLLADRLLFRLFNHVLPAGGFIQATLLTYRVPWDGVLVIALLSLLCGLLPPILAGLRYLHHRRHSTQAASQADLNEPERS